MRKLLFFILVMLLFSTVVYSINRNSFMLSSDSPCIDAGTDVELKEDINGIYVPQGVSPDIGAFEFVGLDTVPPKPPTGITIIEEF